MRLFISYAKANKSLVDPLVDILRQGGHEPWYDYGLMPGQDWKGELSEHIAWCEVFVYALTPESVESEWCQWEFARAVEMGKKVMPVLLHPVTPLPDTLKGIQYADLSGGFTAEAAARLIGGIYGFVVTITPDQVPVPPAEPRGTPAQVISEKPQGRSARVRRWIAAGSVIVALVVVIILMASGVLRPPGGSAMPSPSDSAESRTVAATGSLSNTPTPTADLVTATEVSPFTLALRGVARNADWKVYTQQIDGVPMALVPKGCFMMGNDDSEADERPTHQVCFDRPFWIDVSEVSNAQFAEFGGRAEHASNWKDANRPRERITWLESAEYCRQRGARLPSESEWEYAARGPDGLAYPWGNAFLPDHAIYVGNSDNHTWDVGSKPVGASWVGALDMAGNVWQWVADVYGPYASGTNVTGIPGTQSTSASATNAAGLSEFTATGTLAAELTGTSEFMTAGATVNETAGTPGTEIAGTPAPTGYRVLRGGSWHSASVFLRSAYRLSFAPTDEYNVLGLRCARSY